MPDHDRTVKDTDWGPFRYVRTPKKSSKARLVVSQNFCSKSRPYFGEPCRQKRRDQDKHDSKSKALSTVTRCHKDAARVGRGLSWSTCRCEAWATWSAPAMLPPREHIPIPQRTSSGKRMRRLLCDEKNRTTYQAAESFDIDLSALIWLAGQLRRASKSSIAGALQFLHPSTEPSMA